MSRDISKPMRNCAQNVPTDWQIVKPMRGVQMEETEERETQKKIGKSGYYKASDREN